MKLVRLVGPEEGGFTAGSTMARWVEEDGYIWQVLYLDTAGNFIIKSIATGRSRRGFSLRPDMTLKEIGDTDADENQDA